MTQPIYQDVVNQAVAGRGLIVLGEFANNCFLVGDKDSVPTPSPAAFSMTVIVKHKEDNGKEPPDFIWICDRVFVEFRDSIVMVGGSKHFQYNLADPDSIKQIGDAIITELANMKKIRAESEPLTEIKTSQVGDTTVNMMQSNGP